MDPECLREEQKDTVSGCLKGLRVRNGVLIDLTTREGLIDLVLHKIELKPIQIEEGGPGPWRCLRVRLGRMLRRKCPEDCYPTRVPFVRD